MKVSVVVPVYRSEQCLSELHRRLSDTLSSLNVEYELIFVEDRGGDGSWNTIKALAGGDKHVRGFQLTRNFGQHAATLCGISQSTGDWIISLDDDLEQTPEDIPKLLEKSSEGYDLVYGVYSERTHSSWRNVGSQLGRWLFSLAIPELNYEYTSFRLMTSEVGKHLSNFDTPFPFVDGFLSWITNNYGYVTITHGRRQHGRSNYNLIKLLAHFRNIFITFSDFPLKFIRHLGFMTFLLGVTWFVVIIVGRLTGRITAPGFASILGAIVLFGGVQMLSVGILGEYLARISFKTSRKPSYIVGARTDHKTCA